MGPGKALRASAETSHWASQARNPPDFAMLKTLSPSDRALTDAPLPRPGRDAYATLCRSTRLTAKVIPRQRA
jgi:hypothetical protein